MTIPHRYPQPKGMLVRFSTRRRGRVALAVVAVAAVAAGLLTGCSSGGSKDSGGGVTVSFWHGLAGTNQEVLQKLVTQFNTAHKGKIKVNLIAKGDYDDTITAYKAAITAKKTPSLVQIYDIGTRFMIDSKQTTQMQSFIDKDKFNVSDIQPNIAGYYSIDNKLDSMPFNTSVPLLYINADAFKKAGLDPSKPPTTIDEIMADAKKLTVKDANGNVKQYGFGAAIYGWFMEQWTAVANKEYCDSGNGRDDRAKEMSYDTDTQTKVLTWWKSMLDQKLALNTGRKTADADNAFTSGRIAMTLESTGSLGGFLSASKFTIGTGYYPKTDPSDSGGPIIGGASLWIDKAGHSTKEQQASWELVKYLSSNAVQAQWHTGTGYFPVSKAALNDPTDKAWVAKRPQFETAIKQLEGTTLDKATQGCLLGVMPKARQLMEDAIDSSITGKKSATDALGFAKGQTKTLVDQYNTQVK